MTIEELLVYVYDFFRTRYRTSYELLNTLKPQGRIMYELGSSRIEFVRISEPTSNSEALQITVTTSLLENISIQLTPILTPQEIDRTLMELMTSEPRGIKNYLERLSSLEAEAAKNPLEFSVETKRERDDEFIFVRCSLGTLKDPKISSNPNVNYNQTDWIMYCLSNGASWAIGYRSQIARALLDHHANG